MSCKSTDWTLLDSENRNLDSEASFIKIGWTLVELWSLEVKEPVKLMQQVKIAHSFLQSVSHLFHFIILSLPV